MSFNPGICSLGISWNLYLSFLPTFAYASVDGGEPSELLEQAIASLDTVRGGLPQSVSRSLYYNIRM